VADALVTIFTVGFFQCQTFWHVPLLPFVFDDVEYIFGEEIPEIIAGDADVDVVVHLNGYADTVALADAKASHQHHFVFQMIFLDCLL